MNSLHPKYIRGSSAETNPLHANSVLKLSKVPKNTRGFSAETNPLHVNSLPKLSKVPKNIRGFSAETNPSSTMNIMENPFPRMFYAPIKDKLNQEFGTFKAMVETLYAVKANKLENKVKPENSIFAMLKWKNKHSLLAKFELWEI